MSMDLIISFVSMFFLGMLTMEQNIESKKRRERKRRK